MKEKLKYVAVGAVVAVLLGIGGAPRQGIFTGQATLNNTTPVIIAQAGSQSFCVKVPDDGIKIYIGNSAVSASTGFSIDPGAAWCDDVNVRNGDLYGLSSGADQDVEYIGSN